MLVTIVLVTDVVVEGATAADTASGCGSSAALPRRFARSCMMAFVCAARISASRSARASAALPSAVPSSTTHSRSVMDGARAAGKLAWVTQVRSESTRTKSGVLTAACIFGVVEINERTWWVLCVPEPHYKRRNQVGNQT